MFRRCFLRGAGNGYRDIMERISYMEKELIELKAFRVAVETVSPALANEAKQQAEVAAQRNPHYASKHSLSHLEPEVDLANPLTAQEYVDLHQFYAQQPLSSVPLANLLHIKTLPHLFDHAKMVHREYLVRVAKRARALNNAPLGLARMPGIQELRKWYEWSFHDMKSTPPPTDMASALEFDKLLRRVFLRHYNVSTLLSQGMLELSEREKWSRESFSNETLQETFNTLQDFFDEFCTGRVRLRFFVGNYMYLSTKILNVKVDDPTHRTEPLYFNHDPETFVGQLCTATSLAKVVQSAIANVRKEYPDGPEIELRICGDENLTFVGIPYITYDVVAAMIDDAVQANLFQQEEFGEPLTTIRIILAQNEGNESYAVRITDTAGGMPLDDVRTALTYWTTLRNAGHVEEMSPARRSWINSPIRMPYGYCAVQAIGGDISLSSIEGHGTDRYVYFPAKGITNIKF